MFFRLINIVFSDSYTNSHTTQSDRIIQQTDRRTAMEKAEVDLWGKFYETKKKVLQI